MFWPMVAETLGAVLVQHRGHYLGHLGQGDDSEDHDSEMYPGEKSA
jgi:hypothetical protein